MERIKLVRMDIENFKGIKKMGIDFSDSTTIFGENASGKTTIMDAFRWVFFNKDSQGTEKFSIRPLDKNEKPIDFLEILVGVALQVDKKQVIIEKMQKQKWVKERGSTNPEFKGNVNEYYWNKEPISEKVFKENISEIINEDLFKMITSPSLFPSLAWKTQRETLMKFASGINDEDIKKIDPRFAEINLENSSIQSKIAICKDTILRLKKDQQDIPARIDEKLREFVEYDVAELELQKKALLELIDGLSKQESNILEQRKVFQEINSKLMDIEFQKSELQKKAAESSINGKKEKDRKINNILIGLSEKNQEKRQSENLLRVIEDGIKDYESKRTLLLAEYQKISDRVFDVSETNCKNCGQLLPQDDIEKMKLKFETVKNEDLESNKRTGISIKKSIDDGNQDIQKLKEKIALIEKEITALEENHKNALLLDIPPVDDTYMESEDYLNVLENQIGLEKELNSLQDTSEWYMKLNSDKTGYMEELSIVNLKIQKHLDNQKVTDRVEELKQELSTLAQKIADQEKQLMLYELFNVKKCELLSLSINKMFEVVNFKLFDIQINGGISETCECVVNGVPYSDLNNGHRVVAGLDIINTLSKLYGKSAPIFIDNAESINDFNLPHIDAQLILLKVSEDKEIVIERKDNNEWKSKKRIYKG